MRWILPPLLLGVMACGGLTGTQGPKHFDYDWECQPAEATRPVPMTCSFRGVSGSGFVCGKVVVVCGRARHAAKLCSGMLQPGQLRKQRVDAVTPALADPAQCDAIRFEAEVVH